MERYHIEERYHIKTSIINIFVHVWISEMLQKYAYKKIMENF